MLCLYDIFTSVVFYIYILYCKCWILGTTRWPCCVAFAPDTDRMASQLLPDSGRFHQLSRVDVSHHPLPDDVFSQGWFLYQNKKPCTSWLLWVALIKRAVFYVDFWRHLGSHCSHGSRKCFRFEHAELLISSLLCEPHSHGIFCSHRNSATGVSTSFLSSYLVSDPISEISKPKL